MEDIFEKRLKVKNVNLTVYVALVLYICEKSTTETELNKLLFFIDLHYASLHKKNGTLTGDTYSKLPFGPTPSSIFKIRRIGISNKFLIFKIEECSTYIEYRYMTSKDINRKKLRNLLKKIVGNKNVKLIDSVLDKLKSETGTSLANLAQETEIWKKYDFGDKLEFEGVKISL